MADNQRFRPGQSSDPLMRMREVPPGSGIYMQIVDAGEHVRVYEGTQSLTVTSSVQSLTVPANATHAEIYLDTSNATMDTTSHVRYWHGTDPTSVAGFRMFHDQQISSATPSQFRVVNGIGTGPIIRANYYRYP